MAAKGRECQDSLLASIFNESWNIVIKQQGLSHAKVGHYFRNERIFISFDADFVKMGEIVQHKWLQMQAH